MLAILAPFFDHFYFTKYGINPRCVPPEQLADILKRIEPNRFAQHFTNSTDALHAARMAAKPNDLVCIAGSFFLAGELRPHLIVN